MAYLWIQFNRLQDFSKDFRDTANFFGTLEPLIDGFEKLSNSSYAEAAVATSEVPAHSPGTGNNIGGRILGMGVRGVQQAFMNLRREVADQYEQLRRIEQILTRSIDAVRHSCWNFVSSLWLLNVC